ncbi:MAG: MarR family transcriptional regulator [Clostridia bacterium]|nr:MarR family transcriptional regulator [Clostridia bacterium]
MISRYEQFTFYVSGIHRNIQRIERMVMDQRGYRGAYAQYLAAMLRHPQGVTAAQLCELCEKDKAAVSRAMSEMIEKGLVRREGVNGYRALLFLTEDGQKAAAHVRTQAEVAVGAAGKCLSDAEREALYQALDRLYHNLSDIAENGFLNDGE